MRTTTISLGDVECARTRTLARRSSVTFADGVVVVGTASGCLAGIDSDGFTERWSAVGRGSVVSLAQFGDGIAAGHRDPAGTVRLVDATDGRSRWAYAVSEDVGAPQKRSRNFYPYAVDACADEERLYVAARRTSLHGGERRFSSVVYAFDASGTVRWRYGTDASATGLDVRGDRLAVAYNRCPGEHDRGVVVLDPETGTERTGWDPGGADGDRRVGDVALFPGGVAVTSYGDSRGYVLDADGAVRWRADLGRGVAAGDTTVYAYPSHVHATEKSVAFITGSTYPEEGREPPVRHPREHQLRCYSLDGKHRFDADARGLTRELAGESERLLVPSAQNRWTRDSETHRVQLFDLSNGDRSALRTDGIATAAALSGDLLAAVEEPVEYHDEDRVRGEYSLRVGRTSVED